MSKKIIMLAITIIIMSINAFAEAETLKTTTKPTTIQQASQLSGEITTTVGIEYLNSLGKSNDNGSKTDKISEEDKKIIEEPEVARNSYEEVFSKYSKKIWSDKLFGYNIFNNENGTVAVPSEAAVGKDYLLSAGDILKIRVFGDTLPLEILSNDIDMPVTMAGDIIIPTLGSFNARGKAIMELEKEITTKGQSKYRDFKMDISLMKMRSLKIFVMGEVLKPGVQVLNPLSNVISAIYSAGGITENSSLRNVKIIRGDKTITLDLYDYLLSGQKNNFDYNLLEGDSIFIPISEKKVTIRGNVKRPAIYELKNEKTIEDIAKLAGGFGDKLDISDIKIVRVNDNKKLVIVEAENTKTPIKSGDIIQAGGILNKLSNGVNIVGNVFKPGAYEVKTGDKLSTLIEKAGGFMPNTFLDRVEIIRIGEDTKEFKKSFKMSEDPEILPEDNIYIYNTAEVGDVIYINIKGAVKNPGTYKVYKNSRVSDSIFFAKGLKEEDVFKDRASIFRMNKSGGQDIININLENALKNNPADNIELEAYDTVKIYNFDDVRTDKNVTIYGEVNKPGVLPYYNKMTLEDLLFLSKNNKESAELEKIEVLRMDKKTKNMNTIIVNYIENPKFIIEADDSVFIRKYENYPDKKNVVLSGQFKYPGIYVIKDDETLNQMIKRAGGYSKNAFPVGAKVIRKENVAKVMEGMNARINAELQVSMTSGTGLKMSDITRNETEIRNLRYDAGRGEFLNDIPLKNGDEIVVEAVPATVKILGEVYFPREVGYENGNTKYDYYIDAAGGMTLKALKDQAYVIKADGKVQKNKRCSKVKIEAGDTIVVPYDPRDKKQFDFFRDSMPFLQWLVTILTVYTVVK